MPFKDPERRKQYLVGHYQANMGTYKARSKLNGKLNQEKLNALKEASPCVDCGNHYPYYVMQYDHIGPDKVERVSRIIRDSGWNAAMAEIEKCELVCANCHTIRTWQRTQPIAA